MLKQMMKCCTAVGKRSCVLAAQGQKKQAEVASCAYQLIFSSTLHSNLLNRLETLPCCLQKREAETDIAASAGAPKKLKVKLKPQGAALSPPASTSAPAHQPSASTAAPKGISAPPRPASAPSRADADRPRALAGADGAPGPSRTQQGLTKAKASAKAQQPTKADQRQPQALLGAAPAQPAAAPARPPAPPKKGVSMPASNHWITLSSLHADKSI